MKKKSMAYGTSMLIAPIVLYFISSGLFFFSVAARLYDGTIDWASCKFFKSRYYKELNSINLKIGFDFDSNSLAIYCILNGIWRHRHKPCTFYMGCNPILKFNTVTFLHSAMILQVKCYPNAFDFFGSHRFKRVSVSPVHI